MIRRSCCEKFDRNATMVKAFFVVHSLCSWFIISVWIWITLFTPQVTPVFGFPIFQKNSIHIFIFGFMTRGETGERDLRLFRMSPTKHFGCNKIKCASYLVYLTRGWCASLSRGITQRTGCIHLNTFVFCWNANPKMKKAEQWEDAGIFQIPQEDPDYWPMQFFLSTRGKCREWRIVMHA